MVGKAKTTMQKHQQITDFQVLLIFNQQEDPEYRITLAQGDGIVVWEVQLAERRSPTRLVIACRRAIYPPPFEGARCVPENASNISSLATGGAGLYGGGKRMGRLRGYRVIIRF